MANISLLVENIRMAYLKSECKFHSKLYATLIYIHLTCGCYSFLRLNSVSVIGKSNYTDSYCLLHLWG
jgi:hypothetical protein